MEIFRNEHQVVPLKLSEEEYAEIEQLAACNYTPEQVALYLSMDPEEFNRQLLIPGTDVQHHYAKGILQAEFEISSKLLENAKSGNITAVQTFEKRQESVSLHNLKRKFLNDGY